MKPALTLLAKIIFGFVFLVWSVLAITFDPNILKRTFFRLTHQVYALQDIGESYPRREVAVQVKDTENPSADARRCIEAFEIFSLDDGQTATCRVFVNRTSYERFKAGNSTCELARAVQGAYASAKTAEVFMNEGSLCS
ncbi:hypothetical protein FNU79_07905 [Deinococcus detaillensis]|uniref:Uncharacterized protein n=1 Tax=Deinococcus detaillensis TaxID=2592048 RepID=A0A553V0Z5_9DEIO|nr:hypothetical protein [Deinococcus detaillensis]TSA86103.1 hypothetical protein FNU79_07905 [Deinococcus detaillensis]